MAEGEMRPENRRVALAGLAAHPRNYNTHPALQVERLTASLRKFGQVRSIVVWRSMILAGHGVVEAARALGWREIAADVLPDAYPEHLALAYVAADNELARLGEPDHAQLAAILQESAAADAELLAAVGYDEAAWNRLLDRLLDEAPPADGAQDTFADFGSVGASGGDDFIAFRFGDYGGRVSKDVYRSFVAQYQQQQADSGQPMLDDVLRRWLDV